MSTVGNTYAGIDPKEGVMGRKICSACRYWEHTGGMLGRCNVVASSDLITPGSITTGSQGCDKHETYKQETSNGTTETG